MDARPAGVKAGRRDGAAADAAERGLRTRRPQGAIRVTEQDGTAPGEGQDLREAGTQGHGRDGDFLPQKGKRGERDGLGLQRQSPAFGPPPRATLRGSCARSHGQGGHCSTESA